MKVLIDARRSTWQPELGISRYVRSLVAALLEHCPPEMDLRLVDFRSSGRQPRLLAPVRDGTHVVDRAAQEQIDMQRLSRDANVLHLPWYEGPAAPSCPLILNVHDLDTLVNARGYSWRFRAYYNSLVRIQARRAAGIIVPSRASYNDVRGRWPRAKVVLIPYGVDEVFFGARRDGVEDAPPLLLYSGGYGYRKRVEDLLTAYEHVAAERRDVRLVLTGRAPRQVHSAAQASPAASRIGFTGLVSDDQLASLYGRATVVVYPSLLEGFGFPVLEAFAAGAPVVAARSGSIPEIAHGAARLVEPCSPDQLADAILEVLDDTGLASELRARGRERATEFQWATTAQLTLELYRAVA